MMATVDAFQFRIDSIEVVRAFNRMSVYYGGEEK